jgi:hypothetical protein
MADSMTMVQRRFMALPIGGSSLARSGLGLGAGCPIGISLVARSGAPSPVPYSTTMAQRASMAMPIGVFSI